MNTEAGQPLQPVQAAAASGADTNVQPVIDHRILHHVHILLETYELHVQNTPVPADRAFWGISVRSQAKIATVRWHAKHLKHLSVKQANIDPFKIYSCFAFELAKVAQEKPAAPLHPWPISVAVALMADLIQQAHNVKIDEELLETIVEMAIHDTADPDHAIGRNGLHLIFTMLEKTLRLNGGVTLPTAQG